MNELVSILRNRNLILLLTGRLVSNGGDYLYYVALSVAIFHYSKNSTYFISLFWLVRLIPNLALGPFAGALADRAGYRRAMIAADLARMVVVALLALALSSTTWAVIFPVALVVTALESLFRPASVGLIPSLVNSKEERLAANATAIEVNSIAMIVGSAIGGALAGADLIRPLLLFDAGSFAFSAAALALIRPRSIEAPESGTPVVEEKSVERAGGVLAGFRLLTNRPVLVFAASAMVLPELASGAITVWIVPYAIQSLHLGNAGVGYLYSGLGAGMAAGGIITALLASSVRLEPLLAVSVAAGGVAMALFGLFPVIVGALLCIIAMGAAETVKFAAYETLVQQAVPESMIGQASGSLDSLFFNMMLVGNVASGALAAAFGLTPAIAGLGMLTVIGVGAAWWKFRLETARQPDIAALSTIPAFAHLPPELLQWVVRRMVREEFPAGAVIMRQGDPGDRFYALARGSVEVAVTSNGNTMKRRLAPGNVFGEIALLQDIARTATVRTLEPAATYSLSREDFQELQRRATEFKESLLETATARLAEDTNFKMAIATRS